jgi:AraC family transcriptional regulator, regulatory protein of adaptative response / methylated-DNA-[protein]-cysteine methyltransferase
MHNSYLIKIMQLSLLPKEDTMYKTLLEKDSSFEGVFYAAIKTRGIFCRPTCHARKLLKKNVEYSGSTSNALNNGYRPYKVCKQTNGNAGDHS